MTEDRHDPVRKQQLDDERFELLERIERWLDTPMFVLGLVWLALLVLEFTRGLGAALTVVVLLAGAAGMLAFERDAIDVAGGGIHDFGTALWWTAMVLTTMGSDYFPRTAEGRALCLALALYGFTVFGYVTATLATFFVARDAEDDDGELAGQKAMEALRQEIVALRAEVRALGERSAGEQGRGEAPS
jgi:hypothetical protein